MIQRLITLSCLVFAFFAFQKSDRSFKPLFDGKDTVGWKHVGEGHFTLEQGCLKTVGGMGLLYYAPKKFGNVVIRVVYKTTSRASNSGIFIRIPEIPTEPWMPVNKSYEVQIDDSGDDYHVSGVLYSITSTNLRPGLTGKWNTMEITLDAQKTVVTLNNIKITDFSGDQPVPPKKETWEPDRGPRPLSGYIGLQNHSEDDTIYFKEISYRLLH